MMRYPKRGRRVLAKLAVVSALAATVPMVAIAGVGSSAQAAAPAGTPTVTVSPSGTRGFPFLSEAADLATHGYTESEYQIAGTATSYTKAGSWTSNGQWKVNPGQQAAYRTRILVRRPAAPARFNGTVLVEWLNVSSGADLSPDYWFAKDELLRAGYAWVGVSAQATSVNGEALLGMQGLKKWDPARYGSLTIPSDAYSYDIFTQAGRALLHPNGANPLGGLTVRTLLADGESQSAGFMTTYADAIQPVAKLYNGILIHSNSSIASPLDGNPLSYLSMPNPSRIRTDLSVPTLVVLTETDVPLAYTARQPDTRSVVHWEVAGTSHGDIWEYSTGLAATTKSLGYAPPSCPANTPPMNEGPGNIAMNAAVADLTAWARGGPAAPSGAPLQTNHRDPATNLATGGIRYPDVAVPTATYIATRDLGQGLFCSAYGATDPWNHDSDPWDKHDAGDPSDPSGTTSVPEPDLTVLYPTHADYVAKVTAAANADVAARYLLPADAAAIIAAARTSTIGT